MRQKLKIGILANSHNLPLWKHYLIKRLLESNYATIELFVFNDNNEVPSPSFLKKISENWHYLLNVIYNKIDKKIFNFIPDAFEIKDVTSLIKDIPQISVKTRSTKFSDYFSDNDTLAIKNHRLDVLIRFGFNILRGEILNSAKYGVWSYHHGDNNVNRGGPAGFWEVMENSDITGSILQILSEDLDSGTVLYRSYSATDKRSVHRNKNKLYWKSLSFIPRKLEELYNSTDEEFFKRIEKENTALPFYSNRLYKYGEATNYRMFKLMSAYVGRLILEKFQYYFYLDQWILLFSLKNGIATSFWRYKAIIPPKDRFYADPFVVNKDGGNYLFFEELPYKTNKGHISVMKIDENGYYEKPQIVLNKPYHLSYPFIFEHEDELYLIPESCENKTIELYKCTDFPLKWEFQMNLMENVVAVDSTLFFHQGKWWLFANLVENDGGPYLDELFLFYSDSFLSTSWTPHPLSPIVSDVTRSRPAGQIFVHEGKIIRPSQNSEKLYGYGMKFNEITVLNETDYQEREISSITPDWDEKILATHTFNHSGNLTVIDGYRRRHRFF